MGLQHIKPFLHCKGNCTQNLKTPYRLAGNICSSLTRQGVNISDVHALEKLNNRSYNDTPSKNEKRWKEWKTHCITGHQGSANKSNKISPHTCDKQKQSNFVWMSSQKDLHLLLVEMFQFFFFFLENSMDMTK